MLRKLPQAEFPSAYLLPRLLARQAVAAASAQACYEEKGALPFATDQDITKQLLVGRLWVYQQLNSSLRRSLALVFQFFEWKSVFNWLRVRKARASVEYLDSFLDDSLLCAQMRSFLREETDASLLAQRLESFFCLHLDPHFSGIAAIYQKKGIPGFERRCHQLFFEHLGGKASEGAVRFFFNNLLHLRNILALAKSYRWQTREEFAVSGFEDTGWQRALENPARATAILARNHWRDGLPQNVCELAALEDFLMRRLGLIFKRQAGSGVAEQIISCLWQQEIQARNWGLLLHGHLLGNEMREARFIQ
jgi:hypothetical protein